MALHMTRNTGEVLGCDEYRVLAFALLVRVLQLT